MVDTHLFVFYGSQTGCAESIAKRVQSDGLERHMTVALHTLNEFEKCGVLTHPSATVLIVCSTTGNGDPPTNAEKFWRYLKKKAHPTTLLEHVRFTVLALGDTNYDKFCYMGKNIHRRLGELGAKSYYMLGCADEAMGLEDCVEPWLMGHWAALSASPVPASTVDTSLVVATGVDAMTIAGASTNVNSTTAVHQVVPQDKRIDSAVDHLHIFFGSQTGCAESIAKRIQADAAGHHIPTSLNPLNAFEKEGILALATPTHVVIVCSTTGNGDPPTNAEKFWRFLKKKAHPRTLLQHVRFSVLALGDTNYDKFCYMGKSIHRRMKELGGVCMHDLGCADEAMGLEDTVEPYVLGLWSALLGSGLKNSVASSTIPAEPTAVVADGVESQAVLPIASEGAPDTSLDILTYLTAYSTMFPATVVPSVDPGRLPRFQDATVTVAFDTSSQVPKDIQTCIATRSDFMATITRAKYLTTPSSTDRKVLWLELDTAGMGMTYVPGDSIGIRCPNHANVVSYFVRRLGISSDELHAPCVIQSVKKAAISANAVSLFHLLTHHYDLQAQVKKAALRVLAQYCPDGSDDRRTLLYLCSKDGPTHFQQFVEAQRLSLVDILHLFPTCTPPIAHILSLLPTLSPRYYSIASSPLSQPPDRVHIACTVVEYTLPVQGSSTGYLRRRGLCTSWLEELAQPLLATCAVPLSKKLTVPIFHHPTKDFTLPANPSYPLILVGPGTGVAPFVGFAQHRQLQVRRQHLSSNRSSQPLATTRTHVCSRIARAE
ncbi:hypothetical protein, variant 1 [Aphanomyces invadans]|uniref:Flavodoxin-like domain-containing protein n=1 Tax=Aphanomyces invadans TaxID=157072 RepID=A0A024TRM8_9STRA|nr:hypothetical protein, variant 1 [Aphanomyces invadans]ETV96683.1 hypothetical protein, variant 1 [Aphanomyces invadans]|eukprot:XP_008874946.1 hypothetical protein, variant 1 [Aphanomyces invadans]